MRPARLSAVLSVCAGILVLMAVGLYFGLEHHEHPPAESSRSIPGIASPAVMG